jgi:hypothetical protein
MYAHIIPKVYQKSWCSTHGKNNVFYFDKDNIKQPICSNGGNIKKNLGKEDEYIISSDDKANGLDAEEFKIENFFDRELETKWNDVINSDIFSFLDSIKYKKGTIVAIKAEDLKHTPFSNYLLDFVIIQNLRIFENFIEMDKGTIDLLLEYCYECLKEHGKAPSRDEFDLLKQDDNYKKSIWKSILLDCSDKGNMESFVALVRNGLKKCNLTFFYVKNDIKSQFILSDNPVIWNTGDKKYKTLESGIYFPITPKCLIAFLDYGRDDIKNGDAVCVSANENFIKYINYILLTQSKEVIGFIDKKIADHISDRFNKETDWDIMFK